MIWLWLAPTAGTGACRHAKATWFASHLLASVLNPGGETFQLLYIGRTIATFEENLFEYKFVKVSIDEGAFASAIFINLVRKVDGWSCNGYITTLAFSTRYIFTPSMGEKYSNPLVPTREQRLFLVVLKCILMSDTQALFDAIIGGYMRILTQSNLRRIFNYFWWTACFSCIEYGEWRRQSK